MDVIIGTSKIIIGYPSDRQQPKEYRVQVGRSSGNYFFDVRFQSTIAVPGGPRELAVEHFLDGNITGVYYVLVSAVHYDNTQVNAPEFTVNVIVPTDSVIAPVVSVY